MKIKRVLQGTALTALAAAAWMGAGSTDASAAAFPSSSVSIDGSSLNVTFSDPELMVSVLKVGKGKTDVKITSWDVYEGSSAKIDLSKLKAASDNYIALKTDNTDAIVLHIAPSNAKYKAKYNAKDKKIVFTGGTDNAGLEYRTAYTNWSSVSTNATFGGEYQYQGATIYIREVSDLHAPTATETKFNDITVDKDNPVSMDVYEIGALPGKEIKFNIAAQAKGPSVTADYAKGVVKIKKDLEYRFVGASIGTTSTAVEANGKDGISVNDIVTSGDSGVLEVRTAAKGEGEKSKAASKWTRVKVQKLADLTSSNADLSTLTTGGAITKLEVLAVSGKAIDVSYVADNKGNIKSVLIKNNSDAGIEYVVGTDTPKVTDKSKAVKAGKDAKIAAKDATGNLYIRVAGDKKKQVWVTNYANVGTFAKIN